MGLFIPKILIVDDDNLSLAAQRRVIQNHYVTVTANDPIEALQVASTYTKSLAVVISDYKMPFMNGVELLSKIYLINQNIQRILLTGYAELPIAVAAINCGKICAFLTKPLSPDLLLGKIGEALAVHNQNATPDTPSGYSRHNALSGFGLSKKEHEILGLIIHGYSNGEIAQRLGITVGTVKSHIIHIFDKTNARSRTKLIALILDSNMQMSGNQMVAARNIH
ncbi:MAG: response regulator transcription factor [Negativicutes bacterium]|nr:response regulator transcription factor [Negativicutes bacterium]